MPRPIQLVVTDLDGTLWQDSTNGTRDALEELSSRGIPVLATTARGASATFEAFGRVEVSLPAVMCNGALGRFADGITSFHQEVIPTVLARELLDLFTAFDLVPHVAVDHPEYSDLALPNASSCSSFDEQCGAGLRSTNHEEVVSHDVTQLRVIGVDRDRIAALAQVLLARRDIYTHFVEDTVFGNWSHRYMPTSGLAFWRTATQQESIRRLC